MNRAVPGIARSARDLLVHSHPNDFDPEVVSEAESALRDYLEFQVFDEQQRRRYELAARRTPTGGRSRGQRRREEYARIGEESQDPKG